MTQEQAQQTQKPLAILSAGGTGGHMTPAAALGRVLLERGYVVEVLTDERGMRYASMFEGMPMHVMPSAALGGGFFGKVRNVLKLGAGIVKALFFLMKRQPQIVVGFGGYPSVPGVLAAQLLRVPTILHEQNAIIGKANAFLAGRAKAIAVSLQPIKGLDEKELRKTVLTGNPVRGDIEEVREHPYEVYKSGDYFNVFVVGGSLGAKVLSEVVPETLVNLDAEYRSSLRVVQQCRAEDIEAARKIYEEGGVAYLLEEFIDDVASALSQAHLVIARSGASTVAELAVAGRPAIFVPYPHHKDQQQKMNANALGDVGAAWVMSEDAFNTETLGSRMALFFQNPDILKNAAENAKKCVEPGAAQKMADLVASILAKTA